MQDEFVITRDNVCAVIENAALACIRAARDNADGSDSMPHDRWKNVAQAARVEHTGWWWIAEVAGFQAKWPPGQVCMWRRDIVATIESHDPDDKRFLFNPYDEVVRKVLDAAMAAGHPADTIKMIFPVWRRAMAAEVAAQRQIERHNHNVKLLTEDLTVEEQAVADALKGLGELGQLRVLLTLGLFNEEIYEQAKNDYYGEVTE